MLLLPIDANSSIVHIMFKMFQKETKNKILIKSSQKKVFGFAWSSFVMVFVVLASLFILSAPVQSAFAEPNPSQAQPQTSTPSASLSSDNAPTTCGGKDLGSKTDINDKTGCPIVGYLIIGINILTGAVGLVVVASIIFSGIQYSAARDDPQKIAAAKSRIVSAVLALLMYVFMFTFLQWVVPGGVLN